MFTATRLQAINKPTKFKSLNNGTWYYNYDIIDGKTTFFDISENKEIEQPTYSYIQVRILGTPTIQKCLKAILETYKDENKTSLYNVLLQNGTNDQIDEIKYNIQVDFKLVDEKSEIEKAKESVLKSINYYDSSKEVNSFNLNGEEVWLDKSTRVGLMNSITIEKNSGKTESSLWLNGKCITVNCDAAIQMLSSLELYALACYNKTAEHKLAVSKLTSTEDIKSYDYTIGYPNKLTFTI